LYYQSPFHLELTFLGSLGVVSSTIRALIIYYLYSERREYTHVEFVVGRVLQRLGLGSERGGLSGIVDGLKV
jgi:hypothetical protein